MRNVSAEVALARTQNNSFRQWFPSPKFPNSAANRYASGDYFLIGHTPKFRLSSDDTFFTIGSCFARNVENKLMRSGCKVLTSDFSIPAAYYVGAEDDAEGRGHRGVLNKYNPDSMRTEILRGLGRMVDIPNNGFIEVSDGLWYDPQATRIKPNSLPIIAEIRGKLTELNQRVRHASVVFITLGLTETWFDRETGLSLNVPPPPQYLKRFGDRFFFKNTTCAETIDLLHDMITAVRQESGGQTRFVLTVSPVPMGTTFTGLDAVVANTYSKSTLRSAAAVVAAEYDFVDYFPSFEMVVNSPREIAWKADAHHVQDAMVGAVISRFSELYFGQD